MRGPLKTDSLSLHEARARALAAQGFDRERGKVDAKALERVVAATQLFQIDSVSVVVRAHYLPLFSRLGVYDRGLLDEAAWGSKRSLFEYWAHEASLVPFALQPLFRWRMRRASLGVGIWKVLAEFGRANQPLLAEMLARIRNEGPKVAGDFEKRATKSWFWSWSNAKRALEWLFWSGKITTATRRSFERVYDLPERVLPAAILALPTPSDHDAHLELTRRAVRALGIANRRDIRDYFRTALADTDPCIAELVEAGELVPVRVDGLRDVYYAPRAARAPRRRDVQALLAPFDPVVWQRQRTHDLFGFHYRLEIYTPAPLRKHGYYVLPFLLGDRLVARVDLKSDRKKDRLHVIAVHAEADTPPHAAGALLAELRLLADWLGLARVAVGRRGNFASKLRDLL
jgi:uncharacterized protein YcaQ